MKKLLYLFLFLIQNSFGQGIDNLWLMGYDCCHPPYFHPMNLDFSTGSLVIDTVQRNMNFRETNGEICDKNGNLLFYSNGFYIANAMNDTMMNGSGINPCYFTTLYSDGLTIPQANLIIPFPDDSMKYYLFHESSDDYVNTYSAFYLYYSIIDMSLDNGLGAVVQKNTILLNDTLVLGRLTACKHANGRDWWLFSHEFLTGIMYKFLITPQGIQGPFIQDLQTVRDNYVGQVVFSRQGDKFVYYEPYGDLDIFDFDRCSGNFSNRLHIDINDSAAGGGAAFSPSGRFLYISSIKYVYQFDLSDTNIMLSQKTVAVWDSFYAPIPPLATAYYLSQLAPDNKIYINCGNSTTVLHVINYPDSAGAACGFCQHCIQLPAFNAFTIPNHPNYFLGPESGTVCDSIHIDVPQILSAKEAYTIFPNPVKNILYISQNKKDPVKAIQVFNSLGQVQQKINYSSFKNIEYVEVNISTLTSGIYFLEMMSNKNLIVRRFVKE